ncbi:hypothetical protein [Terrisporobacter hibernicus]|uniref:Phage protein n=1 Tax=Terrisporobacter hibernicus TaxID=2813371 RepID=A0AAX2ZII5_9FIRM|nr:hypothetical protein [Terrisporobacter hibernicus]UEL48305.1 hypothetical protein JW646_02295 [Terrisporobacter hibernicus]
MSRNEEFESISARYLFEQYEIYLKVNGLSKEENKSNKLDSVEDFF